MKRLFSLILLFIILAPQIAFAGVNTHAVLFVAASSQTAVKASPTGLPSGGQARTIIAYVKTSAGGETYFFGYGSDTTAGQFDLTTDTNLLSVRQNGGNRRWVATNITDGNWHKIAIVYPVGQNINSATVDAYMDTTSVQLSDSSSGSGVTNTVFGCIRIGADSGGSCLTPSVFFNGSIDDVQVWNTNLSTAQIDAAWDGCNLSDSATNLVGRWRLDNDFNDSHASANHMTAVNSPTFTASAAYTCAEGAPAVAQPVMWID